MFRLYFHLLPRDLILESALYLNYMETQTYCLALQIQSCDSIWHYKMVKELSISSPLDLNTVLPLSLKYLELKSVTGVDFGSEYFLEPLKLIQRASRLKNSDLREALLAYIFELPNVVNESNMGYVTYIKAVMIGSLSVNDTYLYQNYWQIFANRNPNWTETLNINYIRTVGYAEAGNLKEAESYRNDENLDEFFIAIGLARGGHLELLKSYLKDIEIGKLLIILSDAATFGRENVINYLFNIFLAMVEKYHGLFPKRETYDFTDALIRNNRPVFTLDIINRLPSDIFDKTDLLIESAAKAGLLSIIIELKKRDAKALQISNAFSAAFSHNHFDIMLYLAQTGFTINIDENMSVLVNPFIIQMELDKKFLSADVANRFINSNNIKPADRQLLEL